MSFKSFVGMAADLSLGHGHYRKLVSRKSGAAAEGAPRFGPLVSRERILGTLKRIEPSALLLSAPAGYGKTCIAAQYASDGGFEDVIWVCCEGRLLSGDALLSLVAGRILSRRAGANRRQETHSRIDSASDALTAIRNAIRVGMVADRVCVVLDDVRFADVERELGLLMRLMEAECDRSVLVITARELPETLPLDGSDLVILGKGELAFDVSEVQLLIDLIGRTGAEALEVQSIYEQSQGHAALLTVLARHRALASRQDEHGPQDMPRLLLRLATEQLATTESELLYALALLGRVGESELQSLSPMFQLRSIERISDCIPMVQLSGGSVGYESGASAHTIVQEVFRSERYRDVVGSERAAELMQNCLRVLLARGEYGRALDIVACRGNLRDLKDWLKAHARQAVSAGFGRSVRTALDNLPPEMLLETPALLLLSAEIGVDSGSSENHLARAVAARDVALCEGDFGTYADALMLIAGVHMDSSVPVQAIEPLVTLLALPDDVIRSEQRAVATAYLLTFCVLTYDWASYHSAKAHVDSLLSSANSAPEVRARLLSQSGLALALLGENMGALEKFREAADCRPVSVRLRAMTVGNYSTVLTETGRLDHAATVLEEALAITEDCGLDLYHKTFLSGAGTVQYGLTAQDSALAACSGAAACLAAAGDYLSESMVRLQIAMMLRAAGRTTESVTEIERVLGRAVSHDTRYLEYFAEAEMAANLLAMDDLDAALLRAGAVRAACISFSAQQHVLRAELVLAEVARRRGRMDESITRIFEQEQYLLSGNANWLVGMYMRSFPHLLGMIAAALGPDRIPAHMLKMLVGRHIEDSLSAAREHLEEGEWRLLARRLLGDEGNHARIDALATAPICRVRLFGGFELTVGTRRVSEREWAKRKARLLFATLVLKEGRETPREQLYEHLWPEMDMTRSRNNFYVIWSSMKAVLSPGLGKSTPCPYMSNAGGVCRSNPELVRSDTQEFDEQYREARKARRDGDVDKALSAFDRLAEIYRGDLLPGDMYEEWFVEDRDRYRHDFGDAMLAACDMLAAKGDSAGASRLVRKAIVADPWREDLYQAMLRLQIASGHRSAAVETYLSCRSRLVDDLGLDPSAETVRLYEQVLAMEDLAEEGGFR